MKERRQYPRFRKIYWIYFVLIEAVLVSYVIAHAADKINSVKEASWYEHADLMTTIIILLLSVIGVFVIRLLNRMDKNQALLFERQNEFNTRLSNLEGAHHQAMSDLVHRK